MSKASFAIDLLWITSECSYIWRRYEWQKQLSIAVQLLRLVFSDGGFADEDVLVDVTDQFVCVDLNLSQLRTSFRQGYSYGFHVPTTYVKSNG